MVNKVTFVCFRRGDRLNRPPGSAPAMATRPHSVHPTDPNEEHCSFWRAADKGKYSCEIIRYWATDYIKYSRIKIK